MEPGDICNLAEDRFDFRWSFSAFERAFVAYALRLCDLTRGIPLVMRDSKKERTYDFLRVWFLVRVDLHLYIKAAVTSIRVRQNTFTNRDVDEGEVRAAVVNHIQRGCRRRGSSCRFSDFDRK